MRLLQPASLICSSHGMSSRIPRWIMGKEPLVIDVRSVAEIEDVLRHLYNAAVSLFNSRDDTTRWLGGTDKQTVEVLGDGTIKRGRVQTRLHSWCSPRDRVIQSMAYNRHRDGLWYKAVLLRSHVSRWRSWVCSRRDSRGQGYINDHLVGEIEIDGVPTTRLAEIVGQIANRKWDQYLERLVEGRAGSADLNIWVSYSTKRIEFAECVR